MRTPEILLVMSALSTGGLACAAKPAAEATEVPAPAPRELRFAAPRAGPFSCLWKNAGAVPVRLTARLTAEGSVRVHSVHPAP